MLFTLKKIVSRFFFPMPLVFEVFLLGIILIRFTKKQRTGKALVISSFVLLFLFSNSCVANRLMSPLEKHYAPLCVEDTACQRKIDSVPYIVVLGGGHNSNPQYPITDQINIETMVRVAEAIRLHRYFPQSKIIFSGGLAYDPVPNAEIMARTAMVMGLDSAQFVLETKSLDTHAEAVLLLPMLKTRPFIMVTTASHMPRAMAMFRKKGMRPIAAPVGFAVKERANLHPDLLFPKAGSLKKSENAFYEYIGLAWAKVRGQI